MTPAQKRTARRVAMATAAGALTYAGSGVSARAAMRGPMLAFAVLAVANLGSTALVAAKARSTEARFNNLINNGGSFGGDITVNGAHHVTGNISTDSDLNATGLASLNGGVETNGATVSSSGGNINAGGGNVNATNVNGTGTSTFAHVSMGGNIAMNGNNVNNIGSVSTASSGSNIAVSGGGFSMGGNISMNGNNVNLDGGHVNA